MSRFDLNRQIRNNSIINLIIRNIHSYIANIVFLMDQCKSF